MTWAEFVAAVDAVLADTGKGREIEIDYIDVSIVYDELQIDIADGELAVYS